MNAISLSEAVDECWAIYLGVVRGIVLIAVRSNLVLARVAFTFFQATANALSRTNETITRWQPSTPRIFAVKESL